MSENLKAFLAKVSADVELVDRLKAAKEYDDILALAKEIGVELTLVDIEPAAGEISDNELEAISGGGECQCYLGGGGTKAKHGQYPACACVLAGVGKDWDGDYDRCFCALGGYGDG